MISSVCVAVLNRVTIRFTTRAEWRHLLCPAFRHYMTHPVTEVASYLSLFRSISRTTVISISVIVSCGLKTISAWLLVVLSPTPVVLVTSLGILLICFERLIWLLCVSRFHVEVRSCYLVWLLNWSGGILLRLSHTLLCLL